MGFVGGGGNIAIANALTPSSLMYCIANIKQFMELIFLIFFAFLRLRFLNLESNPGRRHLVPTLSREGDQDLVALSCCAGARCLWPD